MHLDFIAEGITEELEEFEKWWSTRTVMLPCKDKKGKDYQRPIQMGLRQRKFYSLIFPKEYLGAIMNTLNPEDCVVSRLIIDKKGNKKGSKQFSMFLRMFRKFMKLKPLPEKDPKDGGLPMRPFKNTRVVGLGIREDNDVTEADGSTHEGM